MDESDISGSKKTSKKAAKHNQTASNSAKRRHAPHNRVVMAPPSFMKALSIPKSSSRHNLNFSAAGLWEWYYQDDNQGNEGEEASFDVGGEGGGVTDEGMLLKNIRGFLMKRRKSPLKGYQKRYFVLEKGFLYFSRTFSQMAKGKVSGMIDLGLAFIHYDVNTRRIDVDGDTHVLHLKPSASLCKDGSSTMEVETKTASHFAAWSSSLLSHEEYRKSQVVAGKSLGVELGIKGDSSQLRGSKGSDVSGINDWVDRTRRTISGVRKDLEVIHEGLDAMSTYVRSSPKGSLAANVTPPIPTPHASVTSSCSDKNFFDNVSETGSVINLESRGEGNGSMSSGSVNVPGTIGVSLSSSGVSSKKKFAIRKKKDKKKDSSVQLTPEQAAAVVQGSMAVSTNFFEETPISQAPSATDLLIIKDDFTAIAKLVYAQFCEVMERLEKLDTGLHQAAEKSTSTLIRNESQIANQLQLLRQTMVQNSELRDRLSQIQSISSGSETKVKLMPVGSQSRRTTGSSYHRSGSTLPRFDSYLSLKSSMSETFFDALEVHDTSSEDEGENTDEEEEEESESDTDLFTSFTHDVLTTLGRSPSQGPSAGIVSVITEEEEDSPETSSHDATPDPQLPVYMSHEHQSSQGNKDMVRRLALPAPISEMADFSIWSLLRRNIGKDLSKISMPVSMNEPLSALQRLCEELEYSYLLDYASTCDDPFDRMVRVACFAVSSYAMSYHRAGKKPFNPILGETFEYVREDKGFKFISEQVSHHPPVAACHCVSPSYEFWQEARIKSKFWGKSMEVFPIGVVNVCLPKYGDHYQWQKVTSCVHNVFGGQRWVDQYGEMTITNKDQCSCKLTFIKSGFVVAAMAEQSSVSLKCGLRKLPCQGYDGVMHHASYWSSKKYVVHGDVYDSEGTKVRHLFGTWNEAMFCGEEGEITECMWKAAEMPPNCDLYYGFGYFAIQLNELLEGQNLELPRTDCRFRPDQRLLEDGDVESAESEKRHVEQIQREAQTERERLGVEWSPNFFSKLEEDGEEKWVSNGSYWAHKDKQFSNVNLPTLW